MSAAEERTSAPGTEAEGTPAAAAASAQAERPHAPGRANAASTRSRPHARAARAGRGPRRGAGRLSRSPIARKIVGFNLLGLLVLLVGVLLLNPFHESLVAQQASGLESRARLAAQLLALDPSAWAQESAATLPDVEGATPTGGMLGADAPAAARPARLASLLGAAAATSGGELWLFDAEGALLEHARPPGQGVGTGPVPAAAGSEAAPLWQRATDALRSHIWRGREVLARVLKLADEPALAPQALALRAMQAGAPVAGRLLLAALEAPGEWPAEGGVSRPGPGADHPMAVALPVALPVPRPTRAGVAQRVSALPDGASSGAALVMAAGAGEIAPLLRMGRAQVLQVFVVALLVSIGLSLALAATLADPLAELATAAEAGRRGRQQGGAGERVRLPDLSARGDEIGRLSRALRGMVAALYDRIDANEQFAADVAHEIKNPLASLGGAIESLRRVQDEDRRARLLAVLQTDVRRLDRLVSDIANASRLDSELVKEEEKPFDLIAMLQGVVGYFEVRAQERGIAFTTDLPPGPLTLTGLEPRLAQVFVNLLGNALSFCPEGGAMRLWARRRDNRVLVVVEDSGPGIPEEALDKIFRRFYSDRPAEGFGQNSGLGLAISKQIVEAHGGVIWAENIRDDAEGAAAPLGARLVVGLPL